MAEKIFKTGQELGIGYDWNIRVNEEDKEFGKELYSALLLCPRHLMEAVQLSVFFKHLLTLRVHHVPHFHYVYDLKTIVAATFHNIQPRAGDNIKDFTAIDMWYERLDKRYNFSLGSNILPLLTTDNLEHLETFDPPYLQQHKGVINEHKMSELFGKTL